MTAIAIRCATQADKPEWLRMRLLLWPYGTVEGFSGDMDGLLADPLTPVFQPTSFISALVHCSGGETLPRASSHDYINAIILP